MKTTDPETHEHIVKTGTLNLVDLAGSESIARSGALQQRAKEAGHINTSLLTLGRVISALVDRKKHIPYRESKLTRLLQESLGGKNKTLLIANIANNNSNSMVEQTLSTLDYALRAKHIQNRPQINISMTQKKYVKELQLIINNYKLQIDALRSERGIILPKKQFQEMEENLKLQTTEIQRLSELFASKTKDLNEVTNLFANTNEQLSIVNNTKQKLENEMKLLNIEFNQTKFEIEKQKYIINAVYKNEGKLRAQAVNVRDLLEDTIQKRDILCDKLDNRRFLENTNLHNWKNLKNEIGINLSDITHKVANYQNANEKHITNNLSTIEHISENIVNMKTITNSKLYEEYVNKNTTKIVSMINENGNHLESFMHNLCDKELKQNLSADLLDFYFKEKVEQILNESIMKEILPLFLKTLNQNIVNIENNVNTLNTNLKEMFVEQNLFFNEFIANLSDSISQTNQELIQKNNELKNEYLKNWRNEQIVSNKKLKENALKTIENLFVNIFDEQQTTNIENHSINISNFIEKQNTLIQSKERDLQQQMLHEMKNQFEKGNETFLSQNCHTIIEKNIMKENLNELSTKTVPKFDERMNESLSDLSNVLTNTHSNINAFIADTVINNNLKKYQTLCARNHKKLLQTISENNLNVQQNVQELNANFDETANLLKTELHHGIQEYQAQNANLFHENLFSSLNQMQHQTKDFNLTKYSNFKKQKLRAMTTAKSEVNGDEFGGNNSMMNRSRSQRRTAMDFLTFQTPSKVPIKYPSEYIPTQTVDVLIGEYIEQKEKETMINYSPNRSHSLLTSVCSEQEISSIVAINFTEIELGFGMKPGINDQNAFIKYCTADDRILCDAQIIEIDGIDCCEKSANFIRTLLSSDQRPMTIKFRNPDNDSDGGGGIIHGSVTTPATTTITADTDTDTDVENNQNENETQNIRNQLQHKFADDDDYDTRNHNERGNVNDSESARNESKREPAVLGNGEQHSGDRDLEDNHNSTETPTDCKAIESVDGPLMESDMDIDMMD